MSKSTLSVTDNRTGKQYEIPVQDGTIRAMDLRQIKVADDQAGLLTYDPGFLNTAACRSAISFIDGQVTWPWKVLAAARAVEQLGAKQVVIAAPVATQAAADRIAARRYEFVCPSVVMDPKGHPAPYGDLAGDTPERLRSIMIAHQAA